MIKGTEMTKLIAILSVAYPRFDTFSNPEKAKMTVMLWLELLADLDYQTLDMAVKKLIIESPYPPTIADVRKTAAEIMQPEVFSMDGAKAWEEVLKAVRVYGYYRQEEALSSLSSRTLSVVNCLGWREICTCEEQGVIRGQFLKMYEQTANREKQGALLPDRLKREIKDKSKGTGQIQGGKPKESLY